MGPGPAQERGSGQGEEGDAGEGCRLNCTLLGLGKKQPTDLKAGDDAKVSHWRRGSEEAGKVTFTECLPGAM